jgi:hypothetical protein
MDLMSAGDDVDELASGVLALIEEVSHVAVLPARALRPSPARLSVRRWAANGSWDQAPNPVLKEQAIKRLAGMTYPILADQWKLSP